MDQNLTLCRYIKYAITFFKQVKIFLSEKFIFQAKLKVILCLIFGPNSRG